jgi:hypothetical protein
LAEFDPARWTLGGADVQTGAGGLLVSLLQRDSPAFHGLTVNRDLVPEPTALQAHVRVADLTQAGSGQVGARLAAAIYNDGSNGLSPPPTPADVNQPSSQVGDVIASISVTATDVSYAVVRCNVAVCSGPAATGDGVTFLVPRTSLLPTSPNTPHRILLRWDAATHQVVFGAEAPGGPVQAVVDPTAGPSGRPVVKAPQRELWHVGNHASAAGTGVDFGAGSSASVQSRFEDVRKR